MSQPLPENPAVSGNDVGPGRPPVDQQFKKGKSGNPGGRPKGLAKAVREIVGDEQELARIMMIIALDQKERTADRISAVSWLSDRGWGKAPQYAPIEEDDPLEMSEREAAEIAAGFDQRLDELAAARERRDTAAG